MSFKKKILFAVLCSSFLFCAKIFSIGAGVQFGFGPAFYDSNAINCEQYSSEKILCHYENITGTLRFFRLPLTIGFGLESGSLGENFAFGFSGFADYRLIELQKNEDSNWTFYSGAGLGGNFMFTTSQKPFGSCGLRVFCGVDRPLFDNFMEVYVQATGNFAFILNGQKQVFLDSMKKGSNFCLKIPVETGIRFHF